MRVFGTCATILGLMCLSLPAGGQTLDSPDPDARDTVEVTGTRIHGADAANDHPLTIISR